MSGARVMRGLGAGLALALAVGLLFEASLRVYFAVRHGAPFLATPSQVYASLWYPEALALDDYAYDPGKLNVLILAGSVLEPVRGVADQLAREIRDGLGREAQIVNLARPAQSSLDSLHKYRLAEHARFDVVIFYHGINEVRANYVAAADFESDYSHYSWYDQVNFFFRAPLVQRAPSLIPFAIAYSWNRLHAVWRGGERLPTEQPTPDRYRYGNRIKTASVFRRHLREIRRIADERGERLTLMTFAYFEAARSPVAPTGVKLGRTLMWGKPEQVMRGIEAHNRVVREEAQRGGVIFLDQQRALPSLPENFIDICHLTEAGGRQFARNVVEAWRKAGFAGGSLSRLQPGGQLR